MKQTILNLIYEQRILDKKEIPEDWQWLFRGFSNPSYKQYCRDISKDQLDFLINLTKEEWQALLSVQLLYKKKYENDETFMDTFAFISKHFFNGMVYTLLPALLELRPEVWKDYCLWLRKDKSSFKPSLFQYLTQSHDNALTSVEVKRVLLKKPRWAEDRFYVYTPIWTQTELSLLGNEILLSLCEKNKNNDIELDKIMSALMLKVGIDKCHSMLKTIHIVPHIMTHPNTFLVQDYLNLADMLQMSYAEYKRMKISSQEEMSLII